LIEFCEDLLSCRQNMVSLLLQTGILSRWGIFLNEAVQFLTNAAELRLRFFIVIVLDSHAEYLVTNPDWVSLSTSLLDDLFNSLRHKEPNSVLQTIRLCRITV
jgi:hypothetical protein